MNWAGAITAFIALISQLLGLRREQAVRKDATQAQAQRQQKEVLDEVVQAHDVRVAVERELAVHPDSLRDDDGFKRPG